MSVLITGMAWFATSVRAGTVRTWNGGGTNANWTTTANWTGGTPVTDDPLVFNGTARQTNVNSIINGTLARINTLTVKRAGFSISGNALQLGGDWSITGSTAWAINSVLYQNIAITEATGGTLTLSGTINNNSHDLTLLGGGNVTFSNTVSGSGGLAHYGTGTALLAVTNSYSGQTTIGGGGTCVLRLGVGGAIPRLTGYAANSINCASGSLDLNGRNLSCNALLGYGNVSSGSQALLTIGSSESAYNSDGFSGAITGSVALIKDGTNMFYLAGANSFSGNTSITAGTLQLRTSDCVPFGPGNGNISISGGATLDLRGSDTEINGLSGSGKVCNSSGGVDAMLSVGANNASSAFAGVIDDSLTSAQIYLTKVGTGALTLSGTNNFGGSTEVSAGTLTVNGSLTSASAVTVDAGATLSGSGTAAGAILLDGIIAPGNGVGTLATGSETWDLGGSYAFAMNSATGTAGTNWDLLQITGDVNLAATINSAFTVKVSSLNGGVAGSATNFDNTQDYVWPIATVTGSISNFDATKFIVDGSQFLNNMGSGNFSIELSTDHKSVDLVFTHTCGINLTTSTYAIGDDGNVHMYFSNPFRLLDAVALALHNCTIIAGTAYGPGFQSGMALNGLPLTFVGASAGLPTGATRLELVAQKVNAGQTAVVNVLVDDACGGKGGFDPVVAQLEVKQGGVARQSLSDIPSAEHYVRIINGTPGLNWACLMVNSNLFVLNSLVDGQDLTLDIGSALGEGDTNVVTLCGQGVAGASALITIGDAFEEELTTVSETTGSDAQYWSNLAGSGEHPLLQITASGDSIVLSWPDLWDGFSVQTQAAFGSQAGWVPLAVTPQLGGGQFTVTVPAATGMFFRLSNQ